MFNNETKIIKVSVDDKLTSLSIRVDKKRYSENENNISIIMGFNTIGHPDNIDDAKEIIKNALNENGHKEDKIKFID